MFKKIIEKIVMTTKCYAELKNEFVKVCNDIQFCREIAEKYSARLNANKTTARKIIRVVNGLIKREDSVAAAKEIKALCNEIIKGE